MLSFSKVSRVFLSDDKPFLALHDVNLEVPRGKFVSLIGPSGCGKSTLLNLAAGLLRPTTGVVRYEGINVQGVNAKAGYITQRDNLLPWRTVRRNVEISLEIQRVPRSERAQRVDETLARVGLADFASHYPAQLSGGMRKRAGLARTLVYGPETLLMDEPFAALDAILRLAMQRDLMKMWEADGRTVLFVTHDLEEAILLSDYVVVFGIQPGRILHVEPVTLPRPRDLVELRATSEFNETWDRLWGMIENQLSLRRSE